MSITFNPHNVVLLPGATAVLVAPRVVEAHLKPGESGHICTCEPADKRAPSFDPFNADVLIYPTHGESKEEELEGVKLTTWFVTFFFSFFLFSILFFLM